MTDEPGLPVRARERGARTASPVAALDQQGQGNVVSWAGLVCAESNPGLTYPCSSPVSWRRRRWGSSPGLQMRTP